MSRTMFVGKKHGRNIENVLAQKPRDNRVIELLKQVELENKRKTDELSKKEGATLTKLELEKKGILNQAHKQIESNVIPISAAKKSTVQVEQIKESTGTEKAGTCETNRIPQGHFTQLDKKVNSLMDCTDFIATFIDFMVSASNKVKYINEKYVDADRRRVDLEHNIEKEWENAYGTFLTGRQLKYTLMERRDYKDLYNLISPIAKFKAEHKQTFKELGDLLAHLQRILELQKKRVYYPRSSLDLPVGDAFRALPLHEQMVVEKNYKTKRGIA